MEKSYYISANAVKYEDRYFTLRAFGDNYTGHYSSPEIY